jgi:hypothetical protein
MRMPTYGRMSFGAFQPINTADQVADVLRGHMPADELTETARQLVKAVKRRNRSRKDSTHLSNLLRIVETASRPPTLAGPIEVFDQPTGGEPLEVVLMSGDNIGDKVTLVPAGAMFVVPKHDDGQLFIRPAGADGPDGLALTGGPEGATVRITPAPDDAGGYVAQVAGEAPC